jgi:hypothetical protein
MNWSIQVRSRTICADVLDVYIPPMALDPRPEMLDDHEWVIEYLEERFKNPVRTSDELTGRAEELRGQAEAGELDGRSDALLALADRCEASPPGRPHAQVPTSSPEGG